jgi:hypothetical protein
MQTEEERNQEELQKRKRDAYFASLAGRLLITHAHMSTLRSDKPNPRVVLKY